jgi:hypothetical protein
MPDEKNLEENGLTDVFERALEGFHCSYDPTYEHREESMNDRSFAVVSGAQWAGKWNEQFENKPKPEVNKVFPALLKHHNEYLNNKITADFVSDEEEDDELADTLDGLYRSDRLRGGAQNAHDSAYFDGTAGGYGAWILVDEYEDKNDPDDERQKICWKTIHDADKTVFFEAGAQEYDKSDAEEAWWLQPLSKSKFKKEFPDEDFTSWPSGINDLGFDWVTPDVIWIANYYKVEHVDVEATVYQDKDGNEETYTQEDFEVDELLEKRLLYAGWNEVRQKKYKKKRVHKYIMSGSKILEDCDYISGTEIPIVPFYGMRFVIDGVEYCIGEVRHLRDPQMLQNANYSRLSEISALSPIERPIFDPDQIDGPLMQEWKDMHVKNTPIARAKTLYSPDGTVIQTGPSGYTKPPSIPPATAALMQIIDKDLREISGGDDQGEQVRANMSGEAYQLVQNKISMATFMPLSNMGKSVKRDAEIWLSKMKELNVEQGRKLKSVSRTNETGTIELMKKEVDEDGKLVIKNDFRKAKHKVTIDIGQPTHTKRQQLRKEIRDMIQSTTNPDDIRILTATYFANMEGEGLQDINEYYRMMTLRMGLGTPTTEEKKKLDDEKANKRPDPQTKYLDSETAKNAEKIKNLQADTMKKTAEAEETRADTQKTLSEIENTPSILNQQTG